MTTSNTHNSKINISVVLEYQWTSTRDLIENVEVDQIVEALSTPAGRNENSANNFNGDEEAKEGAIWPEDAGITGLDCAEAGSKVANDVSLKSVLLGLENVGFDLEPDHRVSFHHPDKKLYVYIGKVCDKKTIDRFMLPKEAFSEYSNSSQLTLLIREAGTGSSAQKQDAQVANALTEHLRKNLFPQSFQEPKVGDDSDQGLTKNTKYAQQTHALLNSQSFTGAALATGIEGLPQLQRALSTTSDQQKDQKVSKSKATADDYCLHENKRTKERQIRYVVERVSLWRKLYNGVDLGNGETVRYSLEDSARLVGISKKSLDDYLLQLRFGRMYGFDFLKHQCDNIGQLRKFVRERKNQMKITSKKASNEPYRTITISTNESMKAVHFEPITNESGMELDNLEDKTEENKFEDEELSNEVH